MVSELAATYYQAYKLAFDLAKKAERAFQLERADTSQTYIRFGYWDQLRKGLLAGEKLVLDLRRLDAAYLEQNTRELELVKHISLAEFNPAALIALKDTGTAEFTLVEDDFDRDYNHHYLRRFKSLALTMPCQLGPYQNVLGTLSVLRGESRLKPSVTPAVHFQKIQSIATSSAQSDTGLFEFNFRDERLLPFEGIGAHAVADTNSPQIRFDLSQGNRFDYTDINDLVLEVRYTARAGTARARPTTSDYPRLVCLRQEFPEVWDAFKSGATDDFAFELPITLFGHTKLEFLANAKQVRFDAWWSEDAPGNETGPFGSPPAQITSPGAVTEPAGVAMPLLRNSSVPNKRRTQFYRWATNSPAGTWKLDFGSPAVAAAHRDLLDDLWVFIDYYVSVG